MAKMENYLKNTEIISRTIFEHIPYNSVTYKFTEDLYCHYDVVAEMTGKQFYIELKYRDFDITDYRFKSGILLEYYKYKSLLEKCDNDDKIPVYINIFRDGTLIAYNLKQLTNINWQWKSMNKRSYTESGNNTKTQKIVTLLPTDNIQLYKFPVNINVDKILSQFS